MFNRGHIIEQHHTIGRGTQHGVLDLIELFETRVGNDEVKLVVLFQATDCDENVGRGERARDIGERHVERLQFVWIDRDPVLFDTPALNAHTSDA